MSCCHEVISHMKYWKPLQDSFCESTVRGYFLSWQETLNTHIVGTLIRCFCCCQLVLNKDVVPSERRVYPCVVCLCSVPPFWPDSHKHMSSFTGLPAPRRGAVSAPAWWRGGGARAPSDGQATQDMYALNTNAKSFYGNTKCNIQTWAQSGWWVALNPFLSQFST